MKKIGLTLSLFFLFVFIGLTVIFLAQAADKKDKHVCPVMGVKIDPAKAVKYEYKGKTYLFCCESCVEEFKKDPEKYISSSKMNQPGRVIEDAKNNICPVMGTKLNPAKAAKYVYKGKSYNFCCGGCIEEFKKDPEKYLKEMKK